MNLLKASRDIILSHQHAGGAFLASPFFSHYQYSWLRDGTFIAYSLDCLGEQEGAARFYRWVSSTIEKYRHKARHAIQLAQQGYEVPRNLLLHARFTLNGDEVEEEWGSFQLDGYGTWLWGAAQHLMKWGDLALGKVIMPAAELIVEYLLYLWKWPNFDCWEEFGEDTHPATLGAIYGGIHAMMPYLHGELKERAEQQLPGIKAFLLEQGVKDGHFIKRLGAEDVDASLLWLHVPFQVVDSEDPVMQKTVEIIEQQLLFDRGLHRYPQDTYYGGGQWILLTAWLGWHYAEASQPEGKRVQELLQWIEEQFDENGHLPEQVNHHLLAPALYSDWLEKWGPPASPLLWSHAMYIILRCKAEFWQMKD